MLARPSDKVGGNGSKVNVNMSIYGRAERDREPVIQKDRTNEQTAVLVNLCTCISFRGLGTSIVSKYANIYTRKLRLFNS